MSNKNTISDISTLAIADERHPFVLTFLKNAASIMTIKPFIKIRNIPKVNAINGSDMNRKIGLISTLTIPSTKANKSAVPKFLISINFVSRLTMSIASE